jgi:hypothetical protein
MVTVIDYEYDPQDEYESSLTPTELSLYHSGYDQGSEENDEHLLWTKTLYDTIRICRRRHKDGRFTSGDIYRERAIRTIDLGDQSQWLNVTRIPHTIGPRRS